MMSRTNFARGKANSSLSPCVSRHSSSIAWSSNFASSLRTAAVLSSSAFRTSCTLVGCAMSLPMSGACAGFCCTSLATEPGTCAMCSASCPAVSDFSCGFHVSLSPGTRSKNFRVNGACSSNSVIRPSATDIPFFLSSARFDLLLQLLDGVAVWTRAVPARCSFRARATPLLRCRVVHIAARLGPLGFGPLLHAPQRTPPEPLESSGPFVQRPNPCRIRLVQLLPSCSPHSHQTDFAQYAQVLRHRRLLYLKRRHNVAHRPLPVRQERQNVTAPGLSHRVERVRGCRRPRHVHGTIHSHIGICQA